MFLPARKIAAAVVGASLCLFGADAAGAGAVPLSSSAPALRRSS
jgi:hypothetical protein